MGPTKGTITEVREDTEHDPLGFVKGGDLAVFWIATDDEEAVSNVMLVLDDILQPGFGDSHQPASTGAEDDPSVIYALRARYTAPVSRVNEALQRVADHYGIPAVLWTTGTANAVVGSTFPEYVAEVKEYLDCGTPESEEVK